MVDDFCGILQNIPHFCLLYYKINRKTVSVEICYNYAIHGVQLRTIIDHNIHVTLEQTTIEHVLYGNWIVRNHICIKLYLQLKIHLKIKKTKTYEVKNVHYLTIVKSIVKGGWREKVIGHILSLEKLYWILRYIFSTFEKLTTLYYHLIAIYFVFIVPIGCTFFCILATLIDVYVPRIVFLFYIDFFLLCGKSQLLT